MNTIYNLSSSKRANFQTVACLSLLQYIQVNKFFVIQDRCRTLLQREVMKQEYMIERHILLKATVKIINIHREICAQKTLNTILICTIKPFVHYLCILGILPKLLLLFPEHCALILPPPIH